jgi:hypothetical protein
MKAKVVLLFALACMCAVNCVPAISFQRVPYSNTAGNYGQIGIKKVIDARPVDVGYGEPARLGTVRGGYGNPWVVNLKKGTLASEVRTTTKQALTQSGYSVVKNESPYLNVIIDRFWCDGFTHYNIESLITVQLIGSDDSTVLYKKQFADTIGFTILMSYETMEATFNDIMNHIGKKISEIASSQEFLAIFKANKGSIQ